MMISLIHPSRGRAKKSRQTSKEWIDKIGEGVEYELIVSLDYNDPERIEYLKEYHPIGLQTIITNDNKSVVEATNIAAKRSRGEILVYLSDDFKCPDDWGKLILKEFENENRPLLIKVDDCLQDFYIPVLTIPIMNRSLFNKLGYFWHPWYKSMHVDVDLFHTVSAIGALKNARHLKFPHHHVSNGKAPDDKTYQDSAKNWNQGLEVYNRRQKMKFSI